MNGDRDFLSWGLDNHKFIFTRGGRAPTTVELTYDVSDAESPGLPFKDLPVENDVANCTTTTPAPLANISALFDSAFLNSSAVP